MRHPAIARAKRMAERLPACNTGPGKRCAMRLMVRALLSALPPKRDGSHPLDADRMKLEVI